MILLSSRANTLKLIYSGFHLLNFYLATATRHFKLLKITHICFIWDQIFANLDV